MNVGGSNAVQYLGNTALRPEETRQRPDVEHRNQQLRKVYRVPPQEQILEGELLNKRKQAEGQARQPGAEEYLAEERFKRPQGPLPDNHYAAGAISEYQENSHINGHQVIRERSALVDVFV